MGMHMGYYNIAPRIEGLLPMGVPYPHSTALSQMEHVAMMSAVTGRQKAQNTRSDRVSDSTKWVVGWGSSFLRAEEKSGYKCRAVGPDFGTLGSSICSNTGYT